jgi:hypothetical protein
MLPAAPTCKELDSSRILPIHIMRSLSVADNVSLIKTFTSSLAVFTA